jgi:ubiquinone/menaquinone biosynthesis C-methylase UbiE
MTHEYDQITAFHYSAFRPSLHLMILKECLEEGKEFSYGLDVGCGTGQSSIALTNFCNKVIGIEPSKEMLQKSIKHPRIEYSQYNKKYFDFSDNYFDLVTFAGSLYYAKSQTLLDEVVRVTKSASKIIIYDFELSVDVILEKLNLEIGFEQKLHYDHQVNFDDLYKEHIKVKKEFKNYLSSEISISNLSHLLLSSKDNYSVLLKSLGKENLYNKVSHKLHSIFKAENILIDAITYSIVYQNIK